MLLSKTLKVKKCCNITAKCEKEWDGKFDFVIEVKASMTVCSVLITESAIDMPVYMPEILSVVSAYECQSVVSCWVYIMHNNHFYFTVVHERCFVTFMVTSELYMILTCYLLRNMRWESTWQHRGSVTSNQIPASGCESDVICNGSLFLHQT